MVRPVVSTRTSASSGSSYGEEMPVNSGISPRAGLGVEALAVAALALLERGGDVHQEERAAGLVDHRADLLAGLVERRDRAARPRRRRAGRSRRPPSRSGGCWSRGPPWRRSGRPTGCGVRRRRRGWSRCARPARGAGPCSARASVDLPLPDRPVKNSTRPCSVRRRAVVVDDRRRPRRAGRRPRRRPARRTGSPAGVVAPRPGRRGRGRRRRRRARPAARRPRRRRAAGRRRRGWRGSGRRGRASGVPVPTRASSTTGPDAPASCGELAGRSGRR